MPRLATVAGSVLVLAATLTGCGPGGNAEPGKLPSNLKTSTPAPTAAPSAPTAPTRPAAVRKKNKAGAIAATRYFLDALTYSGPANDTKPLRDSFSTFCSRCDAISDDIETTYAAGGRFEGGGWVATRFKFYGMDRDAAYVDATVTQLRQTWVERSGASPVTYPENQNVLKAFQLQWKPRRGWLVAALDPNQ